MVVGEKVPWGRECGPYHWPGPAREGEPPTPNQFPWNRSPAVAIGPVAVATAVPLELRRVRYCRTRSFHHLVMGRCIPRHLLQFRADLTEIDPELPHGCIHDGEPHREIMHHWLQGGERRLHLGDRWLHVRDCGSHQIQRLLDREKGLGDAALLRRGFLQLLLEISPRHDLFQTASFRRQIGPRKRNLVVDLKALVPNDTDLGVE